MGRHLWFDQGAWSFRTRQPLQRSENAMARARSLLAVFCFTVAATSCGGGRGAPAELSGLWSAGQAACAAGVGVRFGPDSIAAVYDSQQEILFDRPRYDVQRGGDTFRVRIVYDLPHRPGGARARNAHGVLVLARGADGGLRPMTHNFVDGRTGTARMRIADDPAMSAMTLEPCGPHPWREELRGRSGT